MSAYAVCAVAPQGLQRVSAAGPVTAGGPDIVANCPAGKGLLGVGGEASGQSGQVSLETYATPGTGEPTGGVARAFEDQDGYAPAWTLTAYAICANSAATGRRHQPAQLGSSAGSLKSTARPASRRRGSGARSRAAWARCGCRTWTSFDPSPRQPVSRPGRIGNGTVEKLVRPRLRDLRHPVARPRTG